MSNNKRTAEAVEFETYIMSIPEADRQKTIETRYNDFLKSLPDGEYKINILKQILSTAVAAKKDSETQVWFNPCDFELLLKVPDLQIRKFMACFIRYSKMHPHAKGWIRFEWPKLLAFAFTRTEIKKIKLTDLQPCFNYGFDMQVVGKNSPTLCFKVVNVTDEKLLYAVPIVKYIDVENELERIKSIYN